MSDHIHFGLKDNRSQGHFSAVKIQHHRDLSLLLVPNEGNLESPQQVKPVNFGRS